MRTRLVPVLALGIITTFFSCSKTKEVIDELKDVEFLSVSSDQWQVSEEMNQITDDLNVLLEGNAPMSGKGQSDPLCGATVVYDTAGNTKTFRITYDGSECDRGYERTGTVEVSMPAGTRWKDVGATLTVTYLDVVASRDNGRHSLTLNGTHLLRNEEGGLLVHLLTGRPRILHSITSNNMSVRFDDGTARTWQVSRRREYTLQNGGTLSITGGHAENGLQGIAEWGTDRFGESFYAAISEPLVVSGACQYRLVSGEIEVERNGRNATVTFGLDAAGAPVACPSGNFYLEVSWISPSGAVRSQLAPY